MKNISGLAYQAANTSTQVVSTDTNTLINTDSEVTPLICASICSGIGGFEESLKGLLIPHTNSYAIEIDKFSRKTYLANHSVNNMYEDLTKVNPKNLDYVDLLLLSLPCQPFSQQSSTRAGFSDTRGTLTFDALKIVKEKNPKYIIFENVKGMLNHDKGNTFKVVLSAFEELNYNIKYQVLNSKHFNSAQNRERLFIVAIRKDIKQTFEFPKKSPVSKSVNDYITGTDYSKHLYDASKRVPFASKRKTDIIKPYMLPHIKYASDKRICSTKGIAPCIVASSAKTKFFDIKNKLFRFLTLDEMAAIQGFPEDFQWPVSNTQKKKQIGNSITITVLDAILKNLLPEYLPTPPKVTNKVPVFTNTSIPVQKASKTNTTISSSSTCISLLQTIKKKEGYASGPIITKGIKAVQKTATDRTTKIIKAHIDRPLLSKNMYINQALINYTKEKYIFDKIESMDTQELTTYLKNRDLNLYNYDSFADNSDTKKLVLFPYAGGKQGVNKSKMQNLVGNAFKNKKYTRFIDCFVGGGGAVYNSLPILLANEIEEIVINDINKSLINVYRQVQRKPKQVQRQLASISLDYYKEFGKFSPETREEARALHEKLEVEFKELELRRVISPRRSSLFLFLMSKSTGGMLDYFMDTKTCFFETSYKVINIDLLINKVQLFHKILTSTKFKFKSVKYQTILKTYKNDTNALFLIDSPYIKYSETKATTKSCTFTYGIDFNHQELLNKIKHMNSDFIYYNNHNPLIQNFSIKNGFSYSKNHRTYSISGMSKRTKAIEICMTKFTPDTASKHIAANNQINLDKVA